jgi:dolichyl-phosphate-mannose--protein O-mannosyl transferase
VHRQSDTARGPLFDRTFSWADALAISVLSLLAGALRLFHVGQPRSLVFDEVYYAQDACWYVHHAARLCGESGPSAAVHPPLGKWLIAAGIAGFGYNPLGWRIAAVVAGTATVPLVYLLARRLLGSTLAATVAAGLMCFDFLAFVQSRVAMLDVFVTMFSVATVLFAVYDLDATPRTRWPARPWRVLTGVAGGAAIACKWSGVLALLAAVLLIIIWGFACRPRDVPLRATVRRRLPSFVLWFAVVPALVYTATFQGQLYGSWTSAPGSPLWWPRAFLHRQSYMLHFQAGLSGFHPYESPPWAWLLLKRPIVYYLQVHGDAVREILAIGNPLTWWCSLAAVAFLAVRWVRGGRAFDASFVILVTVGVTYLPWLLLAANRQFVFLYYVLPVIPFLCVALGAVAMTLVRSLAGKVVVIVYAAAVIGMFGFFYPVLTGGSESYSAWQDRLWFQSCHVAGTTHAVIVRDGRTYPFPGEGHPPSGWCWI